MNARKLDESYARVFYAPSPTFLGKLTLSNTLPKSHRKEVMPHDNSKSTQ